MQNIKKTLKSKRFWLGTVLPFALAVAAAFVARYQLEISDGATANYMAGQWPVYAPLNALTAFCLTLVVFALVRQLGHCNRRFRPDFYRAGAGQLLHAGPAWFRP